MLTEYQVRRGFSGSRVKEYFVVQIDGDTLSGIVAGPFESQLQAHDAADALQPLYWRRLRIVGGHMVGWRQPQLES